MILFFISVLLCCYFTYKLIRLLLPKKERLWAGPANTFEQQHRINLSLEAFFDKYPDSALAQTLPEIHSDAMIMRYYREINELLKEGKITQEQYDEALEEILPYVKL